MESFVGCSKITEGVGWTLGGGYEFYDYIEYFSGKGIHLSLFAGVKLGIGFLWLRLYLGRGSDDGPDMPRGYN